jgi:hypothetical protein
MLRRFGTMHIGLAPLDGPGLVPVATIPYAGGYDKAAYERTAGVVDIGAKDFLAPVTRSELQNCRFALWFDPAKPPSLMETPLVAQTDQRGIYVDEPHAPWGQSSDRTPITVQIRYLGGKPPPGTLLCIAQYSPSAPFRPMAWNMVSQAPSDTAQSPHVVLSGAAAADGDGYIVVPVPYIADGNPFATAQVSVCALRPGFPIIAFYPIASTSPITLPPPSVKSDDWCRAFFCVVRVLPFHNGMAQDFQEWLKSGPTADLVTQRVFDQVFRTYFLMYPVMRFLRDPLVFQAWRGRILEATDPQRFETAGYMPVTRALSAGQRRMLTLWDAYLNGDTRPHRRPAGRGPGRA